MISYIFAASVLISSCTEKTTTKKNVQENSSKKAYWYGGEAEISSYKLTQARYGELHEGKAVLVYVTEPFSATKLVKADNHSESNIPILKLNFTKKFNTGIYPYSMMTSTFFPYENGVNSLKVSSSSQEWCGHTYMEIQNKKQYEIHLSSYFEGETIEDFKIQKKLLEDDFWSKIRLSPTELPIGQLEVIPSSFFLRLMHKEVKSYSCEASTTENGNKSTYKLYYPELERKITIEYETTFPHKILSWTEEYVSGFGPNKKKLITQASLIKTIKSDYWNRHNNEDSKLRKELVQTILY